MKAYTLIEFLVASSLSLALLFSAGLLLFGLEKSHLTLHSLSIDGNRLKRVQALFSSSVQASDEHRIPGLFRAFQDDIFSTLHNPPKNEDHQTMKGSGVYYSLELESSHRFWMDSKQRSLPSGIVKTRLCRKSAGRVTRLPELALAIGPQGKACVRLSPRSYPVRCGNVDLHHFPCLAEVGGLPHDIFDSTLIIPIRREYLLFVSQSEILRHLGVQGLFVRENQPISQGIASLELTAKNGLFRAFEGMLVRVETILGRDLSMFHEQRLARFHPLESVFYEAR